MILIICRGIIHSKQFIYKTFLDLNLNIAQMENKRSKILHVTNGIDLNFYSIANLIAID